MPTRTQPTIDDVICWVRARLADVERCHKTCRLAHPPLACEYWEGQIAALEHLLQDCLHVDVTSSNKEPTDEKQA